MGARNDLTRLTPPRRPSWFWPVLTGFALVPIVVAVVLYLSSKSGEAPVATAPPTSAPDAASAMAGEDVTSAVEPAPGEIATTMAPTVASAIAEDVVEADQVELDAVALALDASEDVAIAVADADEPASPDVTMRVEPERITPEPGARGFGEVSVRARPWALITVDGKAMGMTPKVLKLTPGRHTITFTRGSDRHSQSVAVVKDRNIVLQHDFD